ncbi:23725_t:CDS:2 [Cetraspora pellucida]|uniref:23725_t:CDS:1 n=1 Tax=Cetraspora pellucida TaxID=1433469 RepID=A0A9N8VTE6_9GLOM|nr:23725_t:CDS:2 [Cetraspora pellucida]
MTENENTTYLTANETKYSKTRRGHKETKEAYIKRICNEKIIDFICWNKINKREFLEIGGSGVIIKAGLIENNLTVVLKTVAISEETNSDNDEFIKEQIKAFHNIGLILSSITNGENKGKKNLIGYENVIKFYGVSSDENANLYLILECADLGNLRSYLSKNTINWEQKVNIARQITCGLYFLHTNGMLHRDLHTKNVVIQKNADSVKAIITDFGVSKVLPRNSKSKQELAGCVPFVDPKLLKDPNEAPDKSSDIYSLGVVMWEITSNGRPPFDKLNHVSISLDIIDGTRENKINGTTNSYIELYTNCWNGNPKSRPKIERVKELIHQEEIISGEKCISDTDIGQIQYKSNKIIDGQLSKKLSEILDQLSIEDLELLAAEDPNDIGRLVQTQAATAQKKKVANSEENEHLLNSSPFVRPSLRS